MITLTELADEINVGLPKYQADANYQFLVGVHTQLKDGGIWASPNLGRVFQKSGDGFVERYP